MRTLSDIGEFGFIDQVATQYSYKGKEALGIGDDCAVIPIDDISSRLVTTDLLIENVHFLKNKISAKTLGFKSLAVNLSDIAAMGGTPENIYISIGLPKNIEINWLDSYYSGIHDLANKFSARLMGGDTTSSPDNIVINILVSGIIKTKNVKYRSGAEIDDIICVNDFIGDSAAGLKVLLEDIKIDENSKPLVRAHNHPEPRINDGKFLAKHPEVHAMLDVSDGIGSDIKHIMKRSGVGARIDLDKLPLSNSLKQVSEKYNWDAIDLAINGGEDYCLLFTVDASKFEILQADFKQMLKTNIYQIGSIKDNNFGLQYFNEGEMQDFSGQGFDHFKPK